MVADDDIYLELLKELGPQERFYAGHVREIENARKTPPTRNPESPHYLTKAQYPMSKLPPFALGANFFLSMDNVRFVSKNRRRLRDLGGMDDISVALRMLARQVHPMHLTGLQHLRSGPCKDDLSDLSASTIRLIHANVLAQRGFCHGFDRYVWMGLNDDEPARGILWALPFSGEHLQVEIPLIQLERPSDLHITTTISTPTHAGIKVQYFPRHGQLNECLRTRLNFPGSVRSCAEILARISSTLNDNVQGVNESQITEWGTQLQCSKSDN